jgi:hypothetical protein
LQSNRIRSKKTMGGHPLTAHRFSVE